MREIDLEMLTRVKMGDHIAFKLLYDHYSTQLYNFALTYLKSKDLAADIVQEVFVKIWEKRAKINTDKSFRSYLFTITLNAVRKHFNLLAQKQEMNHEILFDLTEVKDTFDDRSDYHDLVEKLEALIELMPEKRKTVFIRKKIDGKSQKEIASELQITEKTVEYHLSEANQFLKAEFQKLKDKGLVFLYLFVS